MDGQRYFYRVMGVAKECQEQALGVLMAYLSLIWPEVDEQMFFFLFYEGEGGTEDEVPCTPAAFVS